uniref:hypothetical protein n=1 Tax=Eisenbergiella sp. TaxID=1924109 RepID=UPI003AB50EB0
MTREEAIKIVESKLADENLLGSVSISNTQRGERGDAQCIYIECIPVKGNGELIKKLKAMPGFTGYKSMNFHNHFEFFGWFEIS